MHIAQVSWDEAVQNQDILMLIKVSFSTDDMLQSALWNML